MPPHVHACAVPIEHSLNLSGCMHAFQGLQWDAHTSEPKLLTRHSESIVLSTNHSLDSTELDNLAMGMTF
eukprot:640661-Pelagomonas_calceolata.AAC.1